MSAGVTALIRKNQEMLKHSGINGCITGSSMLPNKNFDVWGEDPDIDIFTYTEEAFAEAIAILENRYGFKKGALDSSNNKNTAAQESWKYHRIITRGMDYKRGYVNTMKLNNGEVTVNVSIKQYAKTALEVIQSFDMSIIMIAYDIPTGNTIDLRRCFAHHDENIADINWLRNTDIDAMTVSYWVRQHTRNIKYWNRGFDTRPVAKAYVKMIDQLEETGCIWSSEKANDFFSEISEELKVCREQIVEWLKEKDDEDVQ